MTAEELTFYRTIGPTVAKANHKLSTVDKQVAARLFSRGLIDKVKKNNRIYWQPLPFTGN